MKSLMVLTLALVSISAHAAATPETYGCLVDRSILKDGAYRVVDSKSGALTAVEASKYGSYGLQMSIDGFWLGAMAVEPPIDLLRVDIRNMRPDGSAAGAVAQTSIASRSISASLFTLANELITFTCTRN